MQKPRPITFYVKGMDCAECAQTVQSGVQKMEGVQTCTLNFTTTKMVVEGSQTPAAILQRIRELGYDAEETMPTPPAERSKSFLKQLWEQTESRWMAIAVLLILPGLIGEEILGISHPLITICSLATLVLAGYPIARNAWKALRFTREITINTLMTIAAVGAVIIGETTEAGMVMVLFALGEALEGYTAERARQSIRSLMAVMPQKALRLNKDGREEEVAVEELQIGDVILIKPGESIPMDGNVVAGESHVNQAPITGESQLVLKNSGSQVFASSINGEGVLQIQVSQHSENNLISRLVRMVEEAQEKRAPAQRFVDRFARVYTPVVVLIAILTAVLPPVLFNQPFLNPQAGETGWLYRGLALLVIACPCALVISTPVTIISAISAAARHGVLIKGGVYLEALNQVQAVAFDKTGTLTEGKPSVVSVHAYSGWQNGGEEDNPLCRDTSNEDRSASAHESCTDLIALVHAVERSSGHPIARAIAAEAQARNVADRYPPAESVAAMPGNGVRGIVNGSPILIGSHAYFEKNVPHARQYCAVAESEAAQGYTPLMAAANGKYIGIISVADTVRPDNGAILDQLRRLGVQHMVMLTGDNLSAARSVAVKAGLDEVQAELLPEDKVTRMQELLRKYRKVAMVGDGINDSPVLASSTVGIAIGGAAGTAQAMETADITLMKGDLKRLPYLFRLAKTTMRTIYTNVLLALGIKLLFLILVLAGSGTMWMAVAADMGASLLVTFNGMRLLRYKG